MKLIIFHQCSFQFTDLLDGIISAMRGGGIFDVFSFLVEDLGCIISCLFR
jgi:hypothetical protein